MGDQRAQRTLVKSPPELWAEISDVQSLARHLGEFGEIRITRLEPETTVAWEGDRARGTVELAPSGWGTRVTLTAEAAEHGDEEVVTEAEAEPTVAVEPEVVVEPVPAPEASAEAEPEPVAEPVAEVSAPDPEPARRPRWWARLVRRRRQAVAAEPAPVATVAEPAAAPPEPEPEPVAAAEEPFVAPAPEPEATASAADEPDPATPLDPERVEAILVGVLDDLGSAHHRPFSRG